MAQDLAQFFDSVVKGAPAEYRAEPWYNRYGDCIIFHWREDEFYREWIDDKLTVYRSQATKDAVGIEIKGVVALLQKVGEYGIKVDSSDGTPLALLVLTSLTTAKGSQISAEGRQATYQYLIEQVASQKVAVAALSS